MRHKIVKSHSIFEILISFEGSISNSCDKNGNRGISFDKTDIKIPKLV